MSNPVFTGAAVAIVTPFNNDLSINYEKYAELLEFQISNNTDAIVVCGTTGEAATLSEDEHCKLIDFTVREVKKRVPVIAGTGSNDTKTSIELSKFARLCGADALLMVTPYYNKTSQKGLVAHFTAVADEVNLPIILYNVPSRTGMNIEIDTYIELAKHKNIVAAKEASGNISHIARLISSTNLDVYSGNDDQIVPIMSLGGKGVISVLSNCLPKETHNIARLCLDGDFENARQLQLKYLDFTNALFSDVNPIPVKEAMNLMGFKVGECRLPLYKTEKLDKIKSSMRAIELI